MDEFIRAVLDELAEGPDKDVVKDIAIVSNGVRYDAAGKWHITWRHPER
jgi:2-hydroxy-3-keto-5-methylthiopentenyl-1-phosphate phosphatase